MAKDKLTEYDATANNNTVVGDVNLAENSMNPSDVNNALREIMSHQKEAFGSGTPLYVDQTNNRVGVNKTPTVALDVSGALSVTGDITASSFNGGQIGGRRNIIINGAMQVAQRGTSFSLSGTADTYITDRFVISNSNTGAWTASQSTDAPTGFSNSLKMDCTTADTSPTFLSLMTKFEGQDLQHLKKGTSSAEKTTLSFFVKSNKTGTYIAELRDIDNNRTIGKAYTISSADTWEQKIITFDGDTTGAFGNDNGNSLTVQFYLAVSSTYSSGTLATSWGSRVNANIAVGQLNLADSTDNEWYITGLQLEVGSQATPFEHRSFGEELGLCQRYFYRWKTDGEAYSNLCIGGCTSTSKARGVAQLPQTMRGNASVSSSGTFRIVSMGGGGVRTGITITINRGHTLQPYMDFSSSGGSNLTAGNPAEMGANNDNDSIIDFNAEL